MKSAELRIGNLVSDVLGDFDCQKIKSIHPQNTNQVVINYNDVDSMDRTLKQIKPIPLTEEWLLKLGFVMELGELTLWHDDFLITKSKHTSDIEVIAHQYEFGAEPLVLPHIKHVHQLQNLYFALCGEELTIKEEIGTTT